MQSPKTIWLTCEVFPLFAEKPKEEETGPNQAAISDSANMVYSCTAVVQLISLAIIGIMAFP